MNKILSICIPTYKRNKLLIRNLKNMLPFILKNKILVYINDNDPLSDFSKNIEFLEIKNELIKYKKNIPSLSMDENMIDVLKRSNSKYNLWLGDDDYIFPDDLEKLYKKLLEKEYDLIILNKTVIKENVLQKLENGQNAELKYYNDSRAGFFKSLDSFFIKNYDNFRYGSLVVKNSYLNINLDIYEGTYHKYWAYILEYLNYIEKNAGEVKILTDKDSVVYMLDCERSWETVRYDAIAGEMNMVLKSNFRNLLVNKYYGERIKCFQMYLLSIESKEIKKSFEEIIKYFNIKSKINLFFNRILVHLYIIIHSIYRKILR